MKNEEKRKGRRGGGGREEKNRIEKSMEFSERSEVMCQNILLDINQLTGEKSQSEFMRFFLFFFSYYWILVKEENLRKIVLLSIESVHELIILEENENYQMHMSCLFLLPCIS